MAKLIIQEWNESNRWASEGSWNFDAFQSRIGQCTEFRGTELKRLARSIKKKEVLFIEGVTIENANPLIHMLESLGAKIAIES